MIPKSKTRLWAFDTETTGVYPWNGARPFYFSFCTPDGETGKFRWKVDPFTRMPEPKRSELEQMRELMEDERNTLVMHNSKFDIRMMQFAGIKWKAKVEDTFFAAHILRTNEITHALKPLAKKYLDFPDADEKALDREVAKLRRKAKALGWNIAQEGRDGKKPVKADYWLASDALLDAYGVGDAERTMLLWNIFCEDLRSDPICEKFYRRELQLQPITMRMEDRGVRVKREVVRREIANNQREIAWCDEVLRDKIGPTFNPNSDKQVAKYVYEGLRFPVEFWTDKGNPSVKAEALQKMDHPVVQRLQIRNSCQDAITNFFQKYWDLSAEDETGQWVLHPDFNQVGPRTGRFSCRNPNLQNVANALTTRSAIPIQARTPFFPRFGYVWFSLDYAGQEIWIFADGAKEERMLEALYAGRDLHSEVAEFIWGKGIVAKEKTEGKKTSRAKAKMMLFGIVYGMGIPAAMDFLKCGRGEAQDTIQRYKTFFPRIDPFMEEVVRKVQDQGYIQTAWGRKIFVDRDFAYKATNYYVQGSGADMMKMKMLQVDKFLQESGLDAHLHMTIHDELVLEVKKEHASKELLLKVQEIMEDHEGHLGIKKLPVEIARVTGSWNLKEEKFDVQKLRRAV